MPRTVIHRSGSDPRRRDPALQGPRCPGCARRGPRAALTRFLALACVGLTGLAAQSPTYAPVRLEESLDRSASAARVPDPK